MRAILTGAAGYVGLHILRELLDHGHDVTAVVRSAVKLGPFLRHPRLRVVETDLEDQARLEQALSGQNVCVHAALIWGDPGSEYEMRDTAVAAKLFIAAANAGISRCLYISSVAVHRPFKRVIKEDDCLSATDFYSATKAAGELVLRAACEGSKMTGVVIRPGPVVGPPAFEGGSFRSPNLLEEIVAAAIKGRPIETGRNEGRQFSNVITLARVVRLLTTKTNPHSIYICVDRQTITWEWIAQLVKNCLKSASEVRVLEGDTDGPISHFHTERLETLGAATMDTKEAVLEHVRYLARTMDQVA